MHKHAPMLRFEVMDIMHQIRDGITIVAAGHHHGNDMDPDHLANAEEREIVRHLSPRKRSEWMASRELLYQIAGLPERTACLYDDFGKPYLLNNPLRISVSHSGNWCSAMISDKSCGVDIQVYTSTVERIAARFLAPDEMEISKSIRNPLHQLHFLWGAKECMYKAYGKKKLEFREHIFILSTDTNQGSARGEIRYDNLHLQYDIYFRMLPEAAWIYCVQRTPVIEHHELQRKNNN